MRRIAWFAGGVCWIASSLLCAGEAAVPKIGPRGAIGPDVAMEVAEAGRLAQRVTVQERTAAAVQRACEQAVQNKVGVVHLPPGEYVFESPVCVPKGLTILGDGSRTHISTRDKKSTLFIIEHDRVRLSRLKLEGAAADVSQENDTYGITCLGGKDVRVDHCELSGFSYATNFANEASAQIDHCSIHHNLRDGLGYGVAVYSGACVLVIDNEFSQNRHSLASNGALDWSSPKRIGKYVHKPGVRETHWEFIHNHVHGDSLTTYQLCAVDTHPGMDGTFIIESNLFEDLRHGVGIRDGSGVIRGNLFRRLKGDKGRTAFGVTITHGTHNNIPVEGTMPRDIQVGANTFADCSKERFKPYEVGKAENVMIDGELVASTRVDGRTLPRAMPRLREMDDSGVLKYSPE